MATKRWSGRMEQDRETKLWVAQTSKSIAEGIQTAARRKGLLQRRTVKRTIFSPTGTPMGEISVDEAGNSHHTFEHHVDAVARPAPVSILKSAAISGMEKGDVKAMLVPDAMSMEAAHVQYKEARAAVENRPQDPIVQAQWRRAKNDMNAARVAARIRRQ